VAQRSPQKPRAGGAHPPETNANPGQDDESLPPGAETRPLGALMIVGFLTVTILVFWYGMFALNLVRN
jgi:hypothetical protein